MLMPLAFGGTPPWAVFVLEAGSAVLLALWVFEQISSGVIEVRTNRIFLPLGGFGVLVLIQLLSGQSISKDATLSGLLLLTSYAIVCFLLIQSVRRAQHVQTIAQVLSSYGAIVAVFAIVQGLTLNDKLYWTITPRWGGWIYGPYVNHNHYAGLMEMLTPIPLAVALSHHLSSSKRILAAGAAGLMASSILLSGSRGGWIALLVELLVLALVLANIRRRALGLVLGGAAAALLLFACLAGPEQYEHLSNFKSQSPELSQKVRVDLARDALVMFKQRPIMGWGLGTFSIVDPQVRTFHTNLFVDHTHNDYLQILAETGVLGFCMFLWLLEIALRRAIRKIRYDRLHFNGLIGLATLLAVVGIIVHSLVDFNLRIPANASLFFAVCTVACSKSHFGSNHA
jgi:O-antigen ligase